MALDASLTHDAEGPRLLNPIPLVSPLHLAPAPALRDGRLPASLTSLVGRTCDIAYVVRAIREDGDRLLTLTGPAGVGKTRLALCIGEELQEAFSGDVHLVPLAPVADPGLLIPTIGQSLGVRERAERSQVDVIADAVGGRRLLLILDNLEHLHHAAPLLSPLLEQCPSLTLLVTSRAMLRLSGERVYPVEPLHVPGPGDVPGNLESMSQIEAVRLLLERARAVLPGFTLTPENARAVAQICRTVDGLPLAIELAAARLRLLSPAALLAALEQQLQVLKDGPRDAPVRLRTMRDAIAWSVDRLSAEEQALFRLLGVFTGGFTLTAVDEVRQAATQPASAPGEGLATLDLVTALADQSLVQHLDRAVEPSRFRLLESIRSYALEALMATGELDAIREGHAHWCLAFAAKAEPELSGADQKDWFARVEAELPNLRAALQWFHDRGDADRGLALASRLNWFWSSRGHYLEARKWLDIFLSMPTSDPVRGRGLLEVANILHWLGDHERATQCAKESVDLLHLDDLYLTMCAWRRLGSIAIDQGEFSDARTYLAECHALMAAPDDTWESCWAEWDEAFAVFLAGKLAAAAGEAEEALVQFRAAHEEFTRIGDHGYAAAALGRMGAEWIKQGDAAQARQALTTSLELAIELGDRASIAWALLGAACLASNDANHTSASLLLDVGTGLREAIGELRTPISGFGHPLLVDEEIRQAKMPRRRAMANERDVALAVDLARSVLSTRPTPDVRDSTGGRASPLTAREHQVLALLAEGMGDKAIAVTLGMSRRTASKHVATILEKLEAESRTAAVTRAMRQGLLAAPSATAS